jgi:hypothetical protein
MIKAYCINLDRKIEKFLDIKKNFDDILNIERYTAIDGTLNNMSGAKALCKTNIDIINSDEINLPYCIIIEDDIVKNEYFDLYWNDIVDFINNRDNVWDFIGIEYSLIYGKPKLEYYNNLFLKTENFRNTGFMIYNTSFLKKNINYISSLNNLDMTITHNDKFIKLIPIKQIIYQLPNQLSDISKKPRNYNGLYKLNSKYIENANIENANIEPQ